MSLIARIWFGKTNTERLKEYIEYVRSTGVKDLTATEGNRGVLVLTRADKETSDIGVISFWRSLRDVEGFAGKNISKAVYYDKDGEYLLSMDPELFHYEVAIAQGLQFKSAATESGQAKDALESIHKDEI